MNEVKKARRPNRTKYNAEVAPAARVSYYYNTYPLSQEEDWTPADPIGWFHVSEAHRFNESFKKCIHSNKWRVEHEMASAYDSMNNFIGLIHEKTAIESGKWFKDYGSSQYYSIEILVHAKNKEGKIINIPKFLLGAEYGKCIHTGDWYAYPDMVRFSFMLNGAQRYLSSVAFDNNNDIYFVCGKCTNAFKNEDKYRGIVPNYGVVCNSCGEKNANRNVIMPHNHRVNLGHIVDQEKHLRWFKGERVMPNYIRMFGVEVETELNKELCLKHNENRRTIAIGCVKSLGRDFAIIKEDGSLTHNGKYNGDREYDPDGTKNGLDYAGFEIVSAPADIHIHREKWLKLGECPHHKFLRAWDTETCGLHIHTSRRELDAVHIGKVITFVNHPACSHFIRKVAGRSKSKFCKNFNKRISDGLHPEEGDRDEKRRVAVNVQNEQTIEFRIFKGTVRPHHIIRNLEFVDAVMDYCYPANFSFSDMGDPYKFMQFCMSRRKDWPIFTAWLTSSGLINDVNKKICRKGKIVKAKAMHEYSIEPDNDVVPLNPIRTDWDCIGLKKDNSVF